MQWAGRRVQHSTPTALQADSKMGVKPGKTLQSTAKSAGNCRNRRNRPKMARTLRRIKYVGPGARARASRSRARSSPNATWSVRPKCSLVCKSTAKQWENLVKPGEKGVFWEKTLPRGPPRAPGHRPGWPQTWLATGLAGHRPGWPTKQK